jgi:branched-chain amino acid transport system substrate-binding protein
VDVGLSRLVEKDGKIVQEAVAVIPQVDQTFGGTFSTSTPAPGRDSPKCEKRDLPWVGKSIPVSGGVIQR